MSERKTENIVRNKLRGMGYFKDNDLSIEEQKSDSPRINKLLKNASKKGNYQGYPEFIISSKSISDFIIVIECKADTKKHVSQTLDKYSDYAVDGVLLYASFLSKEFDVLAVAVSGNIEPNIRISHYLYLRGTSQPVKFNLDDILPFKNYYNNFLHSDIKFRQDYDALLIYSRNLNEELQAKKIKEAHRGLLICGILVALENDAFKKSYKVQKTAKHLANNLVESIVNEFKSADLATDRIISLESAFAFIKVNATLTLDKDFFVGLIEQIDSNVNSFVRTHKYHDAMGQFYIQFLRYANNDKGLGIVLTPPHIAELFADLAEVNKNSIVFDNCCGTSGLLIAAMKIMLKDARGSEITENAIKKNQLIGIEFQDDIYALAVSNMVIHGDGKTNIHLGDCFKLSQFINKMYKPNVGLLNPPYKTKATIIEELDFVLNNLEALQPDGKCIAILPFGCAIGDSAEILDRKRILLEKHTLEAVMSMPVDLFHDSDAAVVTCIMVVTAHRPHPVGKKIWFGYWRNDGFVKTKNLGRIDKNGIWGKIKTSWLTAYRSREVIKGLSVISEVKVEDEWCAEAYMKTDYSTLEDNTFFNGIRDYIIYCFKINKLNNISDSSSHKQKKLLTERKWKYFTYNETFSNINLAKSIDLNKLEEDVAGVDYIGRTRENNGVTAIILNKNIDNYINNENCISIPMVGDSTCYTFWQNEKFLASQNILLLRDEKLNKFNAFFFNALIRLERFRYSYGRTLTKRNFENHEIKLPVDKKNNPDWQFMEDYIKSLPFSKSIENI